MSLLDNFFERKNKIENNNSLKIKLQDDVELHPGYFVRKKLYDKMFEHQKKGVKWLFSIHEQNKGCVLADDMGLGKTLQTIALLSSLFRYNRIKHVLIIAPTTLLINWKQEFKKWANFEMFVCVIDGSVAVNKRIQMIESVQTTEGVLMMTYNLARSLQYELSNLRSKEFLWDYVILDEAHKIKNQSKTTKELNKLPSRLRVAITGTPVQNNLSELWSIFDFSMQGSLLGTYATFKRIYEKPIESGRKKDATIREKVLGSKIAKSLRKIYEPYLLRRTKEEIFGKMHISKEKSLEDKQSDQQIVKKLPPKYDWCIWIRMNETQIKLYNDFLQSNEVKQILANPVTCKSPLVQLNVLKKICDHPRLLTKNTFEKLIYDRNIDLEELSDVNGIPVERLLKESSKLVVLEKLLNILISEKRKILLFSTSTKMLNIIEKILNKNNIRFCRLDGQIVSNDQREQIVQKFRTDKSILLMILTIQVGGVGLTLTEATRVIIVDPNWNPGIDSQAIDRAYRIGQNNPNVIVYRLMTCTSVEEKIYSRQVYKDSLNKQTIGKENDPARYFSSTDLYTLFETGDFNKSKVCDDFNKLHGSSENRIILETRESNHIDLSDEEQAVLMHKEKIKQSISEIYDISEHSLVFSKTFERLNTSSVDFAYLNSEVKTAKDLLLKESILANSSQDSKSNRDVLSAKQRLLTKQFGTEFLPLGKQFNQYREGTKKFEFRRPRPKSPSKIINLDDDEIQFIDIESDKIVLSSKNNQRPSNSLSRQTSSFLSKKNSDFNLQSSISNLQFKLNENLDSNLEIEFKKLNSDRESTKEKNNISKSNLKVQSDEDQNLRFQNNIYELKDSQILCADDDSPFNSTDSYIQLNNNLNENMSFDSSIAYSLDKTPPNSTKNKDIIDLSMSFNNLSVLSVNDQQENISQNEMSFILNSYNESVKLNNLLKLNQKMDRKSEDSKKDDKKTDSDDISDVSIIVLD